MKEKEIKTGQIAMLFITIVPVTKLMILPTLLAADAGVSSWLAAAVFIAADLLVLLSVMTAYKIAPEMDIYNILSRSLGKAAAKVILFVYALYFILRAVMPMIEQKQLFVSTLYEAMPRFAGTIPFILIACYVCYKGLNALARNVNLAVWFVGAALLMLLLLALPAVRFDNFMPFLADGFLPIAKSLYRAPMWFGDYVIVMMFLGKIKAKNNRIRGVMAGGIVSGLITLLFIAVITGIFGILTVRQLSAITKIAKYNITFSNIGRFDWIPIIIMMIPVFLASAAMLYGAVTCLQHVLHLKNSIKIIVPLCALLIAAIFFLKDDLLIVYDLFQHVFNYAGFALQYLFPAILPLLAKRAVKKQGEFEVRYAQ